MSRGTDDEQQRAAKYGRRRAVLEAEKSAEAFSAIAQRLLGQLKRAGAPPETIQALARDLAANRDVTRRRAAVWAIVDALESIEARRGAR